MSVRMATKHSRTPSGVRTLLTESSVQSVVPSLRMNRLSTAYRSISPATSRSNLSRSASTSSGCVSSSQVLPGELLPRVPEHRARAVVDLHPVLRAAGDGDPHGGRLEVGLEPHLALPRGGLGPIPLGDVGPDGEEERLASHLDRLAPHPHVAQLAGPGAVPGLELLSGRGADPGEMGADRGRLRLRHVDVAHRKAGELEARVAELPVREVVEGPEPAGRLDEDHAARREIEDGAVDRLPIARWALRHWGQLARSGKSARAS